MKLDNFEADIPDISAETKPLLIASSHPFRYKLKFRYKLGLNHMLGKQ